MEGQAARRENDMSRAMAASGSRPIPAVFDRLNSEVMKLGEDLGLLYDKIQPVMGAESDQKMAMDPGQDGYGETASELVRTVEDISNRLSNIRHRLIEQRSRIEL